ncbi:MAG: twin-arginine translocase subunit TatC [Angustibacter sp.]
MRGNILPDRSRRSRSAAGPLATGSAGITPPTPLTEEPASEPGESTPGRDGRMPLREHLLELRRRLYISLGAVIVGSIGGWFLRQEFYDIVLKPINESSKKRDILLGINYGDPFSAFNQQIQIALIIGVVITSPIWLYHFWAFITPGLTSKERRYSFGFVGAALPLFFAGCGLAWLVLPNALDFLVEFVPDGGSQLFTSQTYFSFITRIILAFGIAFVLPVVLVALNLVGLLSGRALLHHWRMIIFGCFLFASVATPTPEASSMIVLAGAMSLLFGVAIGICLLLDRRKRRRSGEPDFAELADDEASAL